MKIRPVILAGGGGARLWPLSTPQRPKPLLRLLDDRTLLRATAERVADPALFTRPLLSVGVAFAEAAAAELDGAADLLVEPVGRDTAAAVAAAALSASPETPLLMTPADHAIRDAAGFRRSIEAAMPAVLAGKLVLFGIPPTGPATGYGYALPGEADAIARPLDRFVEKPAEAEATRLIAEGALWNAGLFFGLAQTFLDAFAEHAPDILAAVRRARTGDGALSAAFADAPARPFDKAVMEKTRAAALAPLASDWSDVGDWLSVWNASTKDSDGNVIVGDVVQEGCRNCYLRGEGARAAATGLSDMAVVATPEATLVLPLQQAQSVKRLSAAA